MNSLGMILKHFSRRTKLLLLVFSDCLIAFFCWVVFGPPFSFMIATNFELSLKDVVLANLLSFFIPFIFTFFYFYLSGFYRSLMKFFDSKDSIFRALIGSFLFGFLWGIVYLSQYEVIRIDYLSTVILQSLLLASVFYAFLQISRDVARLIIYPTKEIASAKPVLIYGAGTAGNELFQSIKQNINVNVIGFYDSSKDLKGTEINTIKIFSKEKHIKKLKEKYPNMEVYLAIPSLGLSEKRAIISSLEKFKVAVRSIPALHEIVADQKKMAEIQDLSIDEILPRHRVKETSITFKGKNLMITGAGGSIGSEIVRQTLIGKPQKIVLFELSEINLYSILQEAESVKLAKNIKTELVGILGDVKDKSRLINVIENHDVHHIYHAAAYKHVPIVEYHENISEGIKNNIFGTKMICEAAAECLVQNVVVISTDKAVRPTNIMGASKRFAEMLVQSIDNEIKTTKFCMVRFGNVINSSGSAIPLFRKQIANGGPVTITHKKVTRFFMTIAEASSLVIQAGEIAEGGDVFILDMGEQVKIMDLAEKLIYLSGRNISTDGSRDGIEIREIGLRPGEKLYEELLISGDEIKTSIYKIFKSIEEYPAKEILDDALENLNKHVINNDFLRIKGILEKHVEGFNEN